MRKLPIFALVALACAGAIAFAQTTPLYNLIGTETLRITLGSGSGISIPLDQVRNTQTVSAIGAATTVNSSATGAVGYLVATGAVTNWHITLPNPAYAGQKFYVVNGHTSELSNVNVNVATGTQTQTMQATYVSRLLGTTTPVGWVYEYTGSKWYRIQ